MSDNVTITLTVEEWNFAINSMGNDRYDEPATYKIMDKVVKQLCPTDDAHEVLLQQRTSYSGNMKWAWLICQRCSEVWHIDI